MGARKFMICRKCRDAFEIWWISPKRRSRICKSCARIVGLHRGRCTSLYFANRRKKNAKI